MKVAELVREPNTGQPALFTTVDPNIQVHSAGESFKIPLPEGISSLEEWSQTLCVLPKVKLQRLSYVGVIAYEPKYSKWIQENCGRTNLQANVHLQDFARFLLRCGVIFMITEQAELGLEKGYVRVLKQPGA